MSVSKKAIIYKIYFDKDPKTVYVGMTTRSVNRRLGDHIYKATIKRRQSDVYEWIRENLHKAEIVIEEVCTCLDVKRRVDIELEIINQMVDEGFNLTNTIGLRS